MNHPIQQCVGRFELGKRSADCETMVVSSFEPINIVDVSTADNEALIRVLLRDGYSYELCADAERAESEIEALADELHDPVLQDRFMRAAFIPMRLSSAIVLARMLLKLCIAQQEKIEELQVIQP